MSDASTVDATSAELAAVFLIMIRTLVDDPNAVKLIPLREGNLVTFRVTAPRHEAGKLIGQGGRTARSLRVLLLAASKDTPLTYSLDIEAV